MKRISVARPVIRHRSKRQNMKRVLVKEMKREKESIMQ